MTPRSARGAALGLLSLVALACRTPTAGTRPPGPERLAVPSAPSERVSPPPVALDAPARLLVMPSGKAYLVLRVGPEEASGESTYGVLVLASLDAGDAQRSDTPDRLVVAARELVRAYGPIADAGGFSRLAVTAMFGTPGEKGVALRLTFTRSAESWDAPIDGERSAVMIPRVETELTRYPDEETNARRSAIAFISDIDHRDYDPAWARTSAFAKVLLSRADFERNLRRLPARDAGQVHELTLSIPLSAGPFLPGVTMVAWEGRATAVGPTVEMLVLRLDDDVEWRVSDVIEWGPALEPLVLTRRVQAPGVDVRGSSGLPPPSEWSHQ